MSYQDLEEHGVFLPEPLWGKADLATTVNRTALAGVWLIALAACLLMVLGGGRAATWLGVVLYLLFVVLFALVSNAGIERQNLKIDQLVSEKGADGRPPGIRPE